VDIETDGSEGLGVRAAALGRRGSFSAAARGRVRRSSL